MGYSKRRRRETTEELDRAELLWWKKYGEIEDLYCWVQTPLVRAIIRKNYIKEINAKIPPGATVLDYGCGTGWLSRYLAKSRAKKIIGYDTSIEQVKSAREHINNTNTEIVFKCGGIKELSEDRESYDAAILHGVLHHLTRTEIDYLLDTIQKKVRPAHGKIFVYEPLIYRNPVLPKKTQRMLEIIDLISSIPNRGVSRGFRKISAREYRSRLLIEERDRVGTDIGVSPKECVFEPKELEGILSSHFEIKQSTKCSFCAHTVAQQYLLMSISYPVLANTLMVPALVVARYLERKVLKCGNVPKRWIFELFECVNAR